MRQLGSIVLIIAAAAVLLFWPISGQAAQEPTIAVERETATATAAGIIIQSPTPEPPTVTAAATITNTATVTPIVLATSTPEVFPTPTVPAATAIPTAAGTVAPVLTTIDVHLVALWPVVVSKQLEYYQANGRYFQGLITHNSIPANGNSAVWDNAGSHPSDQVHNWHQFLGIQIPNNSQFAARMDVYNGPAGEGFVGTLYVNLNGQLWSRAMATGPEAVGREHGWRLEAVVTP